MIIKKWDSTANSGNGGWVGLSPKITYTDIVDDVNAATPESIFSNNKLRESYLPNFVFGGMKFREVLSSPNAATIGLKILNAIAAYGSAEAATGSYFIANNDWSTLSTGTANDGTVYISWSAQNPNEENQTTSLALEKGDWLVISDITGGTGQSGTPWQVKLAVVNNTYDIADSNNAGIIQLGYTQTGKNYPVQLSSNKAYVNVPWVDNNTNRPIEVGGTEVLSSSSFSAVNFAAGTNVSISESNGTITIASTDTNTTYSQATSSTLGLVKIGFTESGKNYPVELSNGQMYVNVPWTDTDTNTQLTTEEVEDIVGQMLVGTESGINVVYQDSDGTIDFSVGGGVGLTAESNGLKMTKPIEIGTSTPASGFEIEDGALWFDLN